MRIFAIVMGRVLLACILSIGSYVKVAERAKELNAERRRGRARARLLRRGYKGSYNNIGTNREGSGGLWQQMGYQGIDADGILAAARKLV